MTLVPIPEAFINEDFEADIEKLLLNSLDRLNYPHNGTLPPHTETRERGIFNGETFVAEVSA